MDRALALTWDDWWDQNYWIGTDFSRPQLLALQQFPFLATAREPMRPPILSWRSWRFLGGRGGGKTRAGAEWVRFSALHGRCERIALLGPTLGDVREVMIEGPSGIRSIERLDQWRPEFNVSRRRLEWPNGAVGLVFSAEDPESLRGPQFDAAWCEEVGVWSHGETVWNNLQFALRLGDMPRCVATTFRWCAGLFEMARSSRTARHEITSLIWQTGSCSKWKPPMRGRNWRVRSWVANCSKISRAPYGGAATLTPGGY